MKQFNGHVIVAGAVLALAVALQLTAAPVEWEFPRLGSCHEGMAFSDGVTGVLVWGGGDEIRLTIGRADLWDHRGGYEWTAAQSYTNIVAAVESGDTERLMALFKKETPKGQPRNPYMLPLGRVVLKIPGATLTRGELDPFTGTAWIDFATAGATNRVDIAMAKSGGGVFAMKFPKGVDYTAKTVPATDFPVYDEKLKPLGFEKARVFDTQDGFGGLRWKLPADDGVWLSWCAKDGAVAVKTGRGVDKEFGEVHPFDAVAAASRAHWTKFWAEGARVKVPDAQIQRIFDYGMYRFGAMTDPDGVPAGLQGPWLEDDRLVPWNGDYHFNINVQECYSPAYRGGHFAHLKPLFKMVLSWRPRLRENARRFVGIEDGYTLPHSVDDRGVCIGGFWTGTIDHGSTAWVAAMMMRYYRYSRDLDFLRDSAYDFMKGAMNVYLAMMVEDGGHLALPLGPSPEWGGSHAKGSVGRNPSFQLAAAHRLARDLVDAAAALGETPDPRWLDVMKRLPLYNEGPFGFRLFGEQELTESHRHHSHMAGLFPFDVVDLADPSAKSAVDRTYAKWREQGTSYWTGWCVPWAAVLELHVGNAEGAVDRLRAWENHFCDDGHGSHHNSVRDGFTKWTHGESVMQMDGQCAATAAVLEMMAHEVNGKVEFFRGCPDSWREVSFENLALSDGTRVSARRVDGKIVQVPAVGAQCR
ncbi:MAG: hypothetical protein IKA69_04200 [Kiritimatiellae bacterium]|nr:hypothetical protein [Kiritimatiellia bacterium]